MFLSSRHIREIRESLLAISSGEWFFLACGLILGTCLWVLINRKVVRKAVAALKEKGIKANSATFYESAMGFTILLLNALP